MHRSHIFHLLFLLVGMIPCAMYAMQANTSVLMVRPMAFGKNSQTAGSNVFQKDDQELSEESISVRALSEFDGMVKKLKGHGIDVHVFEERDNASPDSVFPNNWFSIDPHTQKLILYPMMAENRRLERKNVIIDYLRDKFPVSEVVDLSTSERDAVFLEGTGSIVFDYVNQIAYACLSPRTSYELFLDLCEKLNYTPIVFSAHDSFGVPIYHTNVMMAIGSNVCIICLESITDPEERENIKDSLESSGKQIVDITYEQMNHFCGNVLEVANASGKRFFVMSTQAYNSFDENQLKVLSSDASIIHSDLETIETVGGGGARCMLGGLWRVTE